METFHLQMEHEFTVTLGELKLPIFLFLRAYVIYIRARNSVRKYFMWSSSLGLLPYSTDCFERKKA